jgi:GGDEF domain-containing protein
MRDEPSTPRRQPRPVADAPVAELANGAAIAKAWLLALLAATPLDRAEAVPVAAFSREAPGLVAAMLRALASDEDLERLAPGGDLAELAARAGTLAGATTPPAAVAAIEALRACAWQELMAEQRAPCARLVADLADRLSHACAIVLQAALSALRSLPGSVLAVEVDDAERLVAAQPDGEGEAMLARVERALAGLLGPSGRVSRGGPGSYLITTAGADGGAARQLAGRVAETVNGVAAPHGSPLTASIGVAVWPHDGDGPEALAAHARQGALAARAAGVPVA